MTKNASEMDFLNKILRDFVCIFVFYFQFWMFLKTNEKISLKTFIYILTIKYQNVPP